MGKTIALYAYLNDEEDLVPIGEVYVPTQTADKIEQMIDSPDTVLVAIDNKPKEKKDGVKPADL